jgi:pimeloyl-ACP methyl ester carboxylesterase
VSTLLPEVTTPALVLHYRRDHLIPFVGGQQLASGLPNATFVPLDGNVHLPDVTDLDQIEEAIVSHVQRHSRALDGAGPDTAARAGTAPARLG